MFEKIINLGLNLENISDVKDVPKEKQREFNDVVMECLENCKGKVKNGDQAAVDSAIEQNDVWLQKFSTIKGNAGEGSFDNS